MSHRILASTTDPNVDEIRAIRAELAAQFENDVEKLFEHLREIETEEEYRNRVAPPSRLPGRRQRRD